MFRPYGMDEGKYLVRLARLAVEEFIKTRKVIEVPSDVPQRLLQDNYGVFTTIDSFIDGERELRGCIGYPRGKVNTAKATIDSALAAAFDDPRFTPLRQEELNGVTFEVSVLSPLERIDVHPRDLPSHIEVGRHGLVIQHGFSGGLLLPQVPVEYCWDSMTFLNEACVKASMPPDCWIEDGVEIYLYEAQIFRETIPRGDVEERDLIRELRRCGSK
ncbi:TIGR00296 family protein [Thermocladium modestius]|nr:TIGR00296 family protein [Thermocladium modestius]